MELVKEAVLNFFTLIDPICFQLSASQTVNVPAFVPTSKRLPSLEYLTRTIGLSKVFMTFVNLLLFRIFH